MRSTCFLLCPVFYSETLLPSVDLSSLFAQHCFEVDEGTPALKNPQKFGRMWGILLGLPRNNGKEHGNYYVLIIGYIMGFIVPCSY